jgi:hypothetical protein
MGKLEKEKSIFGREKEKKRRSFSFESLKF